MKIENCKIAVFADKKVGFEILKYLHCHYPDDIRAICLVDQTSGNGIDVASIGINNAIVINSSSLYSSHSLNLLKSYKLDYIILAWWPNIISETILSIPSSGFINFHPSYLPYNRGKHYNFWTIVEETPFGVSLHFVDQGIDSGDIISQQSIAKTWEDNGKTLFFRAQKEIIKLFKKTYPKIRKKKVIGKKQDLDKGTLHFANELEDASLIDFNKKYIVRDLLNRIRARTFPPYPSCNFYINKQCYPITVSIKKSKNLNPLIYNQELKLDSKLSMRELFSNNNFEEINKKNFFFKEATTIHIVVFHIGEIVNNNKKFELKNEENIKLMTEDEKLDIKTSEWFHIANQYEYSYHFKWMGRPIIQYPQDMIAMQEIIWEVKPELIIETGIAHGGSLIMYASFMEMMGITKGHILGIDIDIREHNREEIEKHPMFKRITMFEGSSISDKTTDKVNEFAKDYKNIMVVLDSNHTHEHALKELELYSPLVSKGSYCVVFDTIIEDMPEGSFPDRPWDKGDNPKTAVWEFLKENNNFEIDKNIQNKLLITVAPDGYLKRIS